MINKVVKYSIIVPIYNVEEYLSDCLATIIASISSFDCYEVLLIDDGSTDNSTQIAKEFCKKDNNFYYFYKENGGLSSARNFGIDNSKGNYLIFIDSDDVIHPDLFKFIEDILYKYKADLIHVGHKKFTTYNQNLLFDIKPISQYSYKKINKAILAKYDNFAWARIANKELYNNNRFPEGLIYEDVVTTPVLTHRAKLIIDINEPMIGYRKRANSITTASVENQFRLFRAVDELRHRFLEGLVDYKLYLTAFVNLTQSCFISLARLNDLDLKIYYQKVILDEYKVLSYSEIFSCHSKVKFKILAIVAKNKFLIKIMDILLSQFIFFYENK